MRREWDVVSVLIWTLVVIGVLVLLWVLFLMLFNGVFGGEVVVSEGVSG